MKTILTGGLLLLMLVLPLTAYAQGPPNQTIEQVNNDFPRSIIIIGSEDTTRLSLEAIVKGDKVTWSNEGLSLNVMDNKLDVLATDSVSLRSKQHLIPAAAYIGAEPIKTVISEPGSGRFALEGLEQGIYLLSISVKSEQSGDVGIYQTLLFAQDAQQDDLKVFELTNAPLDAVKLAGGVH
jgi:hypothetical protein